MPAPDWVTYVGGACGIVGAVTGIVSYRRVSRLKALDLRLELRTLESETEELLRTLPKLLMKAKGSRLAIASAKGLNDSNLELWKNEQAVDFLAVTDLQAKFLPSADGYKTLTHGKLEDKLVEMRRLKATAQRYADKYQTDLEADDKARANLNAGQLASMARLLDRRPK